MKGIRIRGQGTLLSGGKVPIRGKEGIQTRFFVD